MATTVPRSQEPGSSSEFPRGVADTWVLEFSSSVSQIFSNELDQKWRSWEWSVVPSGSLTYFTTPCVPTLNLSAVTWPNAHSFIGKGRCPGCAVWTIWKYVFRIYNTNRNYFLSHICLVIFYSSSKSQIDLLFFHILFHDEFICHFILSALKLHNRITPLGT